MMDGMTLHRTERRGGLCAKMGLCPWWNTITQAGPLDLPALAQLALILAYVEDLLEERVTSQGTAASAAVSAWWTTNISPGIISRALPKDTVIIQRWMASRFKIQDVCMYVCM